MKDLIKQLLKEALKDYKSLPDIKWLKSQLRNSIWSRLNKKQLAKIKNVYIIGSEAKGSAKPNSDIDIGIIMEPIRGISSINFTENFHNKYNLDDNKPKWNGRLIDFQFFWSTDDEWKTYDKIQIL